MKKIINLCFFFLQIFAFGQGENEISQRYYSNSEYKYFRFQDITSDYGPRASNHNFHGGLDVNDNSLGVPFVVDFTSTVEKIECNSSGLKSIIFSNGVGYRHIFFGDSGDCPNNISNSTFSVNGFYFVNYNSSINPKYAIITPYGKAFAEIDGNEFNFRGNPYTTTNSIIPNDIVAPIGDSGSYINSNGQEVSYDVHLHIQKIQSLTPSNGSLWSDINSDNVLSEFNYQNDTSFNNGYSLTLESQNGSSFPNVRGYNSYAIKTKVSFSNPGTIINSPSQQRYQYCVFDPELIELELKPTGGNYSIIQGVNNWAEISYGGNGSTPIPSNVGGTGSSNLGSWTNTGIIPKAYGSGSYDDYFFTQFIPRVTNDGQDAELSSEARYPDGSYHLRATLTDVQNQEHHSEGVPIVIDNFNPHIKNVEVTFSAQEVYNKGWELNSQGNELELTGTDTQQQINPGDQFDLVVTASEPMLFVRVKVDDPSTGFTNMVGSSDGKSWGLSMFYTGTVSQTDLVFVGKDINGNSILGTNQIAILNEHPISTYSGRQTNSKITLMEDRSHKLNSSGCNVTANAGSNVTIQNGGSTVLQGSGGSSCSWSPTTGLNNPNSCTPTASPSQTTTYTLTVTENGCTDTDTVVVTVNGSNGNLPPNDNCSNATNLTSNISCNYTNGTVSGATESVGANNCTGCTCKSLDDYDVYYKFTAIESSHTVTVTNYASNFDAVIELRTSCSSGTSNYISCYDPSGIPTSVSNTWTGLTLGQVYYIRVFEYNYSGSPPSSSTFDICITHLNGGSDCNIPTNISESNLTGTSVTLVIPYVADAEEYKFRWYDENNNSTNEYSTDNTFELTGLTANTEYHWKAKIKCNGDWTSYSEYNYFTTINGGSDCNIPTNISENNLTGTSVTLVIPYVADAEEYKFRWYDENNNGASEYSTGNTFDLTGLTSNTEYRWKAEIKCNGDWTSYSDSSYFTTLNGGTPNLQFNDFLIKDGTGGGVGNNNSQVDAGEEIDLEVKLYNSGSGDAHNVKATLSTNDSDINIEDDYQSWGTINSGDTDWTSDFDFTVSDTCPEKDVTFSLDITSDEGNWTETFTIHINQFEIPLTYVPDDNFEQELINLGYDDVMDDYVQTNNINTVTSLFVSSKNISDLTGIEDFTLLSSLMCESNQLTSLDISQNKNLEYLWCSLNQITDLDVSQNPTLIQLGCSYNELSILDCSQNSNLEWLECTTNQLTTLNVKNGNNAILTKFRSEQNPNLYCIQIDNETDANNGVGVYEGWVKGTFTEYSEDCEAFGLNELGLPFDNYTVSTVGLTCVNSSDGVINIQVKEPRDYIVQIISDNNEVNNTYGLNYQNAWELNLTELEGGEYYIHISIKYIPEDTYKKTFIINLDEPEPLEVAGKSSGKTYTISLEKGTPPFTIKINGAIVATTSNMEYSMEVAQGDVLEVSSSKQCEGVYREILEINSFEELIMYPNPTTNEVSFNIPESYQEHEITISVFDFNSRLLNVYTPTISNSIAKIKIGHLPTGIYFIHIPALYNQNLKIIKE